MFEKTVPGEYDLFKKHAQRLTAAKTSCLA